MQRFLFLFHPRGVRLARAVSQGSRAGAHFFVTQHAFVVFAKQEPHIGRAWRILLFGNFEFWICDPGPGSEPPKSILDGWNQALRARGELGFSHGMPAIWSPDWAEVGDHFGHSAGAQVKTLEF